MKNLDKPIILSLILVTIALHMVDTNKTNTKIEQYKKPENRYFIIKTEQRKGWWEALEASAEPYDVRRPDKVIVQEIKEIPKNRGRGQGNQGKGQGNQGKGQGQGNQGKGQGQERGRGKGLNK